MKKNQSINIPFRLKNISLALLIFIMVFTLITTSVRADEPSPLPPEEPEQIEAITSIFGVEIYPLSNEGGLLEMKTTNTRFVRGPKVLWSDIQPNNATSFDWSKLNPTIQDLKNALSDPDHEPILVIRSTPSWAQLRPGLTCGPMQETYFDEFANFLKELNKQFVANGITVNYWELWNEPDIAYQDFQGPPITDPQWGGCWGDKTDTTYYGGRFYGKMLRSVYNTIKSFNVNSVVLVGGLLLDCDPNNVPAGKTDCNSSKFLTGILAEGASNSFDGVAFHAYDYWDGSNLGHFFNGGWPNASWDKDGPSLISKAQYIKSVLTTYNASNKLLFNTENSLIWNEMSTYNNPYPPVMEETKAGYVVKAYSSAIYAGLSGNIWYDSKGTWLRNNGLLKVDCSKGCVELPAYSAYEFASAKLAGLTKNSYRRKVTEYPGITGYEFDIGNSRHLWVLWSQDGATHKLYLPLYPGQLLVYDMYGKQLPVNMPVVFDITTAPLYFDTVASMPRAAMPIIKNVYPATFVLDDFDQGLDNWTVVDKGLPVSLVTMYNPYPINPVTGAPDFTVPMGLASVTLGSPDYPCTEVPIDPTTKEAYAAIEADITFPAVNSLTPMKLYFQYIIYSQDYWGTDPSFKYDNFEVYINNSRKFQDGNKKNDLNCKWWRVPGLDNARTENVPGWATGEINVQVYSNTTVKLSFRNYNRTDKYYNTYTYLDTIMVKIGE